MYMCVKISEEIVSDNKSHCERCIPGKTVFILSLKQSPRSLVGQGWGLLSQFPPFRYFPKFSSLSKHTLTVEYRVNIRQVSPQLSCGDTCQIWMWFKESNMYFCEVKNFAYGPINERSFSNPHPRFGCSWWISTDSTLKKLGLYWGRNRMATN